MPDVSKPAAPDRNQDYGDRSNDHDARHICKSRYARMEKGRIEIHAEYARSRTDDARNYRDNRQGLHKPVGILGHPRCIKFKATDDRIARIRYRVLKTFECPR